MSFFSIHYVAVVVENNFVKAKLGIKTALKSFFSVCFGKGIVQIQVLWTCYCQIRAKSQRIEFQVSKILSFVHIYAVKAVLESVDSLQIFRREKRVLTANIQQNGLKIARPEIKIAQNDNLTKLRW